MVCPTLQTLPRVFSLRPYPSGGAVVMHLAFPDPAAFEQTLQELGSEAANAGSARLETADGQC